MNANTAVFAFQFGDLDKEEGACRLAYDRPNLSVYAADGAIINSVRGRWQPGELAKNWGEIRASFWDRRTPEGPAQFLLGDFVRFARFCALAQATEFTRSAKDEAQPVSAPEAEPAH